METQLYNLSGIIILLVLGLRHGLDPDHITIIDQFTYSLHKKRSLWAKWTGSLFALGHGIMVTVIALVLGLVKNSFQVPLVVSVVFEWLPVLLLLTIGISNLIALINKREVKISSFRKWMLPKGKSHLNPFSIVLTGLVFGFIFDTSSQIAAFGFAVSGSDQLIYAALGGMVFSFGLILTGTFDSFLLSKLLRVFDEKKIKNHRFKLNVLITIMCFVIPVYKFSCFFEPSLELNDFQGTLIGIGFIGIILFQYADLYIKYKTKAKSI